MRITVRELREYILALKIVKANKPLLAIDTNLQLYPEITKAETLLENIPNNLPFPRRGQTKIEAEIPTSIQTVALNKAIRYGIPLVCAINRSHKKGITLLDSCYGIAVANKLIPDCNNDFRHLTDAELDSF